MSCPKCGYSGYNQVYHWGTGEIECENCRHDYVPVKKDDKKQSKSQGKEIVSRLTKPDYLLDVFPARSGDVYVNGPVNGASADFSPVGPVRVGRVSGDNRVCGDDGLIVGKITPSGHLSSHWW